MAGRGSWVAVTVEEAKHILTAKADLDDIYDMSDERVRWETLHETSENIIAKDGEKYWRAADKAWWGIHCCLSAGVPDWDAGTYPLKLCVTGGQPLGGGGELAYYVTPEEVRDVVEALAQIDEAWLRKQYQKMENNPDYSPPGTYGEEDFEYICSYFEDMADLFRVAADTGRAVLFECGL